LNSEKARPPGTFTVYLSCLGFAAGSAANAIVAISAPPPLNMPTNFSAARMRYSLMASVNQVVSEGFTR